MDALSSSLQRFPAEILINILSRTSASDQKAIRLHTQHLRAVTESVLFRRIVLVPDLGSLQNLTFIARHQTLKTAVREIIYDGRWTSIASTIRNRTNNAYMFRTQKAELFEIVDRLEASACPSQAHRSQLPLLQGFALDEMLQDLVTVLQSLPKLQHFTIKEIGDDDATFDDLPTFYQWMRENERLLVLDDIRVPDSRGRNDGAQRVYNAAVRARKPITKLQLYHSSWFGSFRQRENGPRLSKTLASYLAGEIRHLCIKFGNHPYAIESRRLGRSQAMVARLGRILSEMQMLETLELGHAGPFDRFDLETEGGWSMFSFLFPTDGQFSRLTSLSLDYFTAREDELVEFLKRHAEVLKKLHLEDIYLVRELTGGPRACWVRIIRQLPNFLQLEKVEFRGHIWNGGRQKFRVAYPGEFPNLEELIPWMTKAQVLTYVITGIVCPLDEFAIQPGHDDLHEPFSYYDQWGDSTWFMLDTAEDLSDNDDEATEGWELDWSSSSGEEFGCG